MIDEFSVTSIKYTVAFEGFEVPGQFDVVLDVVELGEERTRELAKHVEDGLQAFAEKMQQADGVTLVRAFRFDHGACSVGDVVNNSGHGG